MKCAIDYDYDYESFPLNICFLIFEFKRQLQILSGFVVVNFFLMRSYPALSYLLKCLMNSYILFLVFYYKNPFFLNSCVKWINPIFIDTNNKKAYWTKFLPLVRLIWIKWWRQIQIGFIWKVLNHDRLVFSSPSF